jgi:hypothetical protein
VRQDIIDRLNGERRSNWRRALVLGVLSAVCLLMAAVLHAHAGTVQAPAATATPHCQAVTTAGPVCP